MKNQQLKRTTLNGWGKVLFAQRAVGMVVLLFYSSPLYAQRAVGMAQTTDQLPENNPPIQNGFPCTDSSPECVQQLTEAAVSNSSQLKLLDELSGQIFDDELDLVYAVMDGVKARGDKGNYSTQRVKFNSNACG